MKKTITLCWALIAVMPFFINSCGKDDGIAQQPTPGDGEFTYADIKITLPEEANIAFSELEIVAGLDYNSISADGSSKILHIPEERTMAVVVNSQKEPVMVGFIREGHTEISLASTLEACYYFGLGTALLQEPVRDEYFKQSASLKSFNENLTELETQFVANPNFISTEAFTEWMAGKIAMVKDDDKQIDIYAKSVEADANDIRSGLQVFEDAGTSIKIANTYRRRSKAFFYKTAIKKEGQDEQVLIPDVSKYDSPTDKTATIKPIQAKREFLGILGDWAGGTGIEFYRTETDPVALELDDDQEYAKYQVRVVGPAMKIPDLKKMNKQEQEAYDELVYESLTIDFILPFMLDIVGEAKLLDGLDEKYFKNLSAIIKAGASSVPGMTEAVAKGDMEGAFKAFVSGFYNNTMGEVRGNFIEGFRDALINYKISTSKNANLDILGDVQSATNKFNGVNRIMDWTDKLLKAADYYALFKGWHNSNELETWKVKAKQDPVILAPEDAVAFPYIKKYFKAVAKNTQLADGEHFKYVWKTSGTYGKLNDDIGHSGTNFDSTSEEVYYLAQLYDSSVPDDATETVICSVYVEKGQASNFVGTDTVQLRVKSYKYRLRPDGAIVEGNTTISLGLLRPDGADDITSNPELDFRLQWSTLGEYGEFEQGGKTMTTYNNNTVDYKALDDEVKNGTEVIKVRLYGKLKSEPDSGYELYDEVEGKIIVNNNSDQKLTYYAPIDVTGQFEESGIWCNYSVSNVWRWNPSEAQADIPAGFEVDRIHMNVEEYSYWNSCRVSKTWYPGNEAEDLVNGNYELLCWRNSASGPGYGDCSKALQGFEETKAKWRAIKGYAKVTVYLKAEE